MCIQGFIHQVGVATTQFVISCTVSSLGKAHLVLPTASLHIKYTYMSTNDCDAKLMIPYNGMSEHWIIQGLPRMIVTLLCYLPL